MQRGSCCEICGVIAHEGCVKQAPEDCRPITLPADKILHSWKAAGTVMTDTPVSISVLHTTAAALYSVAIGHTTGIACHAKGASIQWVIHLTFQREPQSSKLSSLVAAQLHVCCNT